MKEKKILRNILIVLAVILTIAFVRQLFKENIGINIKELSDIFDLSEKERIF